MQAVQVAAQSGEPQTGLLRKLSSSSARAAMLTCRPPLSSRPVAVSVARGMSYLHSRHPPLLHLDLKSPK